MGELVPAAASILARSIRVRKPTGVLPLLNFPDETGRPIPDIFGNGNETKGIDADVVFKVTTEQDVSPFGAVCFTAAAFAFAFLMEEVTARPIYGVITLCRFSPGSFHRDLETMLHEMLHPLGFSSSQYGQFPGYREPYFDVIQQGENGSLVHTPQVTAAVRRHFNCSLLEGAALEDDLGTRSAGSHWEMRLFRGEVMDAVATGNPDGSGQRVVLTDLTLALLQDTNWYDVKYGSGGFNSYGYNAGCAFAQGTFEEAILAPSAQPYLCDANDLGRSTCLWDHSAEASCEDLFEWDGFVAPEFVSIVHSECQNRSGQPGSRCLRAGSTRPECVAMICSADGSVLVNGQPCDPEEADCPDDAAMCSDPGHLTCVETLNDCSGNGDCLKGRCFCHLAWGGDDCSVPICLSACSDGSPCPPSGFCGVPECGEWSEGSGSRGVPCQAPANFSEPPLVTYESTGVALGPSPTAGPAEAPEDTPSPEPAPPTASADVAGDDSGMDYSDTILGPIAIDPGNDSDEGGSALSPPIGTPGVSYGPPPSVAPDMQATPPRRTEGDSGGLARGSAAQVAAAGVLRAVLTAAAVGAAVRW